jgi:glucose/arabinose dehydrogenase
MRCLLFGLFRAVLAASLFVASPPAAFAQIRADVYISGLSSPLAFIQDPSNASVQYIVQQGGRIRVVVNGVLQSTDFLTLTSSEIVSGGEQGLLGLAFPPDYATSGRFYVNFTNTSGHTVVARFKRSTGNPLVADKSTRFDLRWPGGNAFIAQPFSNHNGGALAFGPDGYLYIGMGDGGSVNDPQNNAQNPNSLLGKMLRISVAVPDSDPEGYDVPPDNPFLDGSPVAALGEIWAFGLRNPWKFSFDDPARGGTGAMLIGDVGQGAWEEIDFQPVGRGARNYGWRIREGAHDNVTSPPPAYTPLIEPIFEYSHSVGNSITGGYVYRGSALSSNLHGRYFFADINGRVWSIVLTINGSTGEATASGLIEHTAELGGASAMGLVSSFGVDASGELYIVSLTLGRVFKISSSVGVSDSSSGGSITVETVHVTNLKITGPAVSLAWDAVTQVAIDGYRIYYGPTSGQESIALDVGNVTTGEVKDLPPGVRIYFVLRAYKGPIESLPSNEVSYVKPVPTQMPTPTPAPPTPDPTLTPQPTPTPYLPLVTPQPIPPDPRLQRLQQRQQRQLWRQQRRQQWREQWRQNRGD